MLVVSIAGGSDEHGERKEEPHAPAALLVGPGQGIQPGSRPAKHREPLSKLERYALVSRAVSCLLL
jgi:hypothetical protein